MKSPGSPASPADPASPVSLSSPSCSWQRGPTLPDLRFEGRPLSGLHLASLEVLLAVDRPDRLEAVLLDGSGAPPTRAQRPTPGELCMARLGGERPFFLGRIERASIEERPGWGRRIRVVAYAEYQFRRALLQRRTYHQVTDSEIALAIASSLELVAVVERTREIHREMLQEGDPLVFLRGRARSHGFELAVTGETLYFVREVPAEGEEVAVRRGGDLLALALEARGPPGPGRGGTLRLRGDPSLRPLRRVVLCGLEPPVDGRYRVVRAYHRMDSEGYRTSLEILEEGLDYSGWLCGQRGGANALWS